MPRVSRAVSDQRRAEIVRTAATLFRDRGFEGTGLAQIMHAVGLTPGTFYSHFSSKDALAEAACAQAFSESAEAWRAQPDVSEIISLHLSKNVLRNSGVTCAATALAADVGRGLCGTEVRRAYIAGMELVVQALADKLPVGPENRANALTLYATLVGALALAHASGGSQLSDEMLDTVKKTLTMQIKNPRRRKSTRPRG